MSVLARVVTLVGIGSQEPWMLDGACASDDVDPDDWWPEDYHGKEAREREARALAVCEGCPVQHDCFEWAIHREKWGVWGATTARLRRRLRSRLGVWTQVIFYDPRRPDRAASRSPVDERRGGAREADEWAWGD